jgi:hypothetical protein
VTQDPSRTLAVNFAVMHSHDASADDILVQAVQSGYVVCLRRSSSRSASHRTKDVP